MVHRNFFLCERSFWIVKILAGENSKIVRRYQHRYVAWSRTIRFIQQIGIPEYQEIIENKQELIRGFKLMILHYILSDFQFKARNSPRVVTQRLKLYVKDTNALDLIEKVIFYKIKNFNFNFISFTGKALICNRPHKWPCIRSGYLQGG